MHFVHGQGVTLMMFSIFSLLTVLISISSGIPNHSASIQVLVVVSASVTWQTVQIHWHTGHLHRFPASSVYPNFSTFQISVINPLYFNIFLCHLSYHLHIIIMIYFFVVVSVLSTGQIVRCYKMMKLFIQTSR